MLKALPLLLSACLVCQSEELPVAIVKTPSGMLRLSELRFYVRSETTGRPVPLISGRIEDSTGQDWISITLRLEISGKADGLNVKRIAVVRTGRVPANRWATLWAKLPADWPAIDAATVQAEWVEGELDGPKPRLNAGMSQVPIAVDEGCYIDLLAALTESGIALRKKMDELIRYQCVHFARDGATVEKLSESNGRVSIRVVELDQPKIEGYVPTGWIRAPERKSAEKDK
ncbi:MAG: hypothetical protein HY858_10430 [Candidatus Solibacter usitatus]|nr:hypothetical protein [Candidatus Solibacter usitatus]